MNPWKKIQKGQHPRGYILVEAIMSMALLSMGLIAIHGAIRQTIIVRGQARDYTQARFLLEQTLAYLELQPQHTEGAQSGQFEGDFSRFSWAWKISKIDIPLPPFPPDTPWEVIENFKLNADYVAKVVVTVSWTRTGRRYEESFETLWPPEKLWLPPPLEELPFL